MVDRLSVGVYPVNVTPVAGMAQQKLLQKLDLMQRELAHVQTAIIDMRRAVQHGPNASLASAVMNSRNWLLSMVISHSYIQAILGAQASGGKSPSIQLDLLFGRAVKAGIEDGYRDGM